MIELHKSGVISATPNTHCFTAVINSCAYCENDALEKRDALQIAVSTYKELLDSSYGGPNHITYSSVITALRNLSPPSEKRTAAIANIFKHCVEAGQVSDLVLKRLQSSVGAEEFQEMVGATTFVNGNVDIDKIPEDWKQNVQSKRF